jgi:undecaprenyl pyrophosphate phosphatase UppP
MSKAATISVQYTTTTVNPTRTEHFKLSLELPSAYAGDVYYRRKIFSMLKQMRTALEDTFINNEVNITIDTSPLTIVGIPAETDDTYERC